MLSEKQIEELAVKIRTFLLNNEIWTDTRIYFNGKAFCTSGDGSLTVIENIKPNDYFDYVNENHILSMSFEGRLYDILNFGECYGIAESFSLMFKECGLYYELGDQWNLTCYYLKDEAEVKPLER